MFSSSPAWSLWPAAPRVVPGGHEERAVISGSPRSRAAPSRVVGVLHDAPRQLLGRVVGALRDAPPQLLGRVVGALLDAPPAQLCGGRAACQMPLSVEARHRGFATTTRDECCSAASAGSSCGCRTVAVYPFAAVGPGSASAAHHPVGKYARQGPAWSRKWQRIAHICLSNTIADMWLSACLVAHLFKTLWHHMPKETSRGRTHIKHPLPTALNARRHRQVPCWAQVFCRLHAHCIGPVTFALSSAFSTERPKALCTGAAHDP